MTAQKRFVFGCGGTGGHIYPGIALAAELINNGCEVLFIGNRNGMEFSIAKAEGYSFRSINIQKLYRKINLSNLLFPFRLVSATVSSCLIIKSYKPVGVVCTGGFVSGPVAIAATLCGIPLFFHESNSLPGITTRFLSRFACITFTSFAQSSKFLKYANIKQLGIPLPEKSKEDEELNPSSIGLDPDKPVILVSGGSQGSQAINAIISESLPQILEKGLQLIWQTGKTGYAEYYKKHNGQKGLFIFDFSPRLKSFYRFSSVAVTRAGAMTISELEENKLPAILIPLPTAADNHQYYNALEQQKKGVAVILQQRDLDPGSLIHSIEQVLQKQDLFKRNLSKLPPNTAARDIVQTILNYLNKEKPNAG